MAPSASASTARWRLPWRPDCAKGTKLTTVVGESPFDAENAALRA
ncbi:hypothetical protein [Rhizobium leguminosarum]|nr:hypothetical protein [Rhizobium leguminosarum]